MQEINSENSQSEVGGEAPVKQSRWKTWLATDDAVRTVYLLFGFFFIVLIMTRLQYSTDAICCGDFDGYYHIRWSSMLWESLKGGHWLPSFDWLPLTVLNPKDYADHHFFFHLLQIPFLWFFEDVTAAKVSAIVFGSLAIFSVYWMLFRYKVNYLVVWLLAIMVCANPFYYRMNMAKAPPLTIIITILGIYLLFERKYAWLLPLMFVFVWTYSLFPLLLFAAIIWSVIIGWNERRLEWHPLAYTGGGMLLGNLINPYFPNNLKLFYEHFATKFSVAGDFVVSVGGEWYPYSAQEMLTHFPVALAAMLLGYIFFTSRNGKLPEQSGFFLMFVTILLAAQFRSKRFAEYFPPFAILFVAFSWKDFFAPNALALPEEFQRDIEPLLDVNKKTAREEFALNIKTAAAWTLGLILAVLMFYNFIGIDLTGYAKAGWRDTVGLRTLFSVKQEGMIASISSNEADDKYRRAMEWVVANVPSGERIYNVNWDDFPKLFFLDQIHTYVYGLDPNYLYTENPDLYKTLTEINSGKVDEAAPIIRDRFGANYIFCDAKENEDMIAKLIDSGWVDTVYEDDEARVLKIRTAKGEAPSIGSDEPPPTEEELKQLDEEVPIDNGPDNEITNEANIKPPQP